MRKGTICQRRGSQSRRNRSSQQESPELITQGTAYGQLLQVREQEIESDSTSIEMILSSLPSEADPESRLATFYDPGGPMAVADFSAPFESNTWHSTPHAFTGSGIPQIAALDDTEIELRDSNPVALPRIQPTMDPSIPSFEPKPR